MQLEVKDFGVRPYREIWAEQVEYRDSIIADISNGMNPADIRQYLLIGEHDSVYTVGFHGDIHNLIVPEAELQSRGIECIRIERGGDITYHGPGQLIVYPIMDLGACGLGVKAYMSRLEDCVIDLLAEYGIKGEKVDGATGVWIGKGTPDERKICAMGIKCSRFVTMHGLALNVNTDLTMFEAINPCGFKDKGVSSMAKELHRNVPMAEVKEDFIRIFIERFGF